MCDTLGFVADNLSVFGKNSDRSPNEPQVLEYHKARKCDEKELKLTYITIPQVKEVHAVYLSRPSWLWGAEMGVNDCGVCIGNEAVWTLGKYGDDALTGMDMLRIALERSESAGDAVAVLSGILEKYGQGGNCGYDHDFHYDNSFLVMDRNELFVMDTAGREYAAKKMERAAISNRLSLGSDADIYGKEGECNFSLRHTEHIYNIASGSKNRRKMTLNCAQKAFGGADIIGTLRQHSGNINPFTTGSVSSPCMHFGGIVGDHTTSSVVAELTEDKTVIYATGSSCPCVALFKPWIFGTKENEPMTEGKKYWYEREVFFRSLLGRKVPDEYYAERDELENKWRGMVDDAPDEINDICASDEKAFFNKWSSFKFEKAEASTAFLNRWDKKTEIFMREKDMA